MAERGSIDIEGLGNGTQPRPGREGEEPGGEASGPEHQSYSPPPRRPKSQRDNAFDFGAWLMQGLLGLNEELRHNDLGLPEEFWVHAYAARRETLLALRALIDAALEKCDHEQEGRPQKKRPQRGRVQID